VDREPRDLFVSGDAFIGRNVSDQNFTLSVHGVAEVRRRRLVRLPAVEPSVTGPDRRARLFVATG
jgi:hypothetical protein